MRDHIEEIPNLSWKDIADIIETDADGTPLGSNLEKINEKMIAAIPHYEFFVDCSGLRWRTIIEDVHHENPLRTPVIAMIAQYDSRNLAWMPHAVVVVQASNESTTYFDPFYGEMVEPTNAFYRKWLALDRFCVRLKHVPRTQRILEEYGDRRIRGSIHE